MTAQQDRPDTSPEAIAHRRHTTDQARAMNMRQGYVFDAHLEECTERYVQGEITELEYREMVLSPIRQRAEQRKREASA